MLAVILIQATGTKIKDRVRVIISKWMQVVHIISLMNMTVSGIMMFMRVKEYTLSQVVINMMANGEPVVLLDKEYLLGLIIVDMRESGKIVVITDLEYLQNLMVVGMKESLILLITYLVANMEME